MQDFFEWYQKNYNGLPWLMVGKGPTFSKIRSIDLQKYSTIALNHVIEDVKSDVSHVIDFDVLTQSGKSILKNARFLLMPFYPHFENKPGDRPLTELLKENEILKQLEKEERLLWYNASTASTPASGSPIVPVKYFSADAVASILGMAGAKKIWTAGVDGGSAYNSNFSHLNDKTLLANGRKSFNVQFLAIAETLNKYEAELIPLGESTIHIFVGTEKDQLLATRVLEYSIRMRTSASVRVTPLYESNIDIPVPKHEKNRPRTPFSFQRFIIPQLRKYQGRAIYVDSDMQVFTDIRDLAFRDMKGQQIVNALGPESGGRKPQFSVMLMDCQALKHWDINSIVSMLDRHELSYEQLMYEMKLATHDAINLESEWNSLEEFLPGKTKLLHYTDMKFQPWLSRKNPRAPVWIAELFQAIEHGFISRKFLRAETLAGNIRPTLYAQAINRISDPRRLTFVEILPDSIFTPPHRQKRWHQKNTSCKWLKGAFALVLVHTFSLFRRLISKFRGN
ncbi:MAG: glycosyltransferase [Gammaproteobacteria bacterium]|nr:glycosyltransferase [Gammaproteobacteria bacterium]MBT8150992.1 glycosyltransferase [Gammaproteobacteria bacterium]NNM12313.1 hypothetical protein [Pseudomonadales bacterium]